MRVIHIAHGKANPNSANGISRVVYFLNKHEKLQGINSEIWAIVDGIKDVKNFQRDDYVTVRCFPRVNLFSKKEIIKELIEQKESIDIVHFHLIWFYDKNIIAKALKNNNIPFVITTHGTYSKPHAYTGKRLLAKWLFELKYLNMATECHILTPEEGTGLKKYGYEGRSFVAYNGFEEDEMPTNLNNNFFQNQPFKNKIILSMVSVLRKDKNIDLIIKAISLLNSDIRNQIAFVIIGPDYKGNAQKYLSLAKNLGVDDSVFWIGPLYNKDKYDALNSSDGYIMASDSEGFSMSIIDAMACAKPMILTSGCNMKYISDEKFYIMCEPYSQDLARAIIEFVEMKEKRIGLGEKAYAILKEKLYWTNIVKGLISEYKRIIGEKYER